MCKMVFKLPYLPSVWALPFSRSASLRLWYMWCTSMIHLSNSIDVRIIGDKSKTKVRQTFLQWVTRCYRISNINNHFCKVWYYIWEYINETNSYLTLTLKKILAFWAWFIRKCVVVFFYLVFRIMCSRIKKRKTISCLP